MEHRTGSWPVSRPPITKLRFNDSQLAVWVLVKGRSADTYDIVRSPEEAQIKRGNLIVIFVNVPKYEKIVKESLADLF